MKTLLITAFEPFGGESENPSALALELLPETIGGIRLEKRLLEVTFLGAKDAVCRYVDEIKARLCHMPRAGRRQGGHNAGARCDKRYGCAHS